MNIQTRLINLSKALETSLENQEAINFKPLVACNSLRLDDDKAEQDPNQEDKQVDYFAIISGIFQLTEAERILLLFAIAREIAPQIISQLLALKADDSIQSLTLTLNAIARISPNWNYTAFTPQCKLRRWNLIEFLEPKLPLAEQPIKLDEQILHFVLGRPYTDKANHIYLSPVNAPLPGGRQLNLPSTWQGLVEEITTLWQRLQTPMNALLIGRKTFLSAMLSSLCSQYHFQLQKLAFAGITDIGRFWQQLPSINRDARLFNLALYIDLDDSPEQIDSQKFIHHLQHHCDCPLFFASREPLPEENPGLFSFPVPPVRIDDQKFLWQAFLEETDQTDEEHQKDHQKEVARVAEHFTLSPEQIHSIATQHSALHKNAPHKQKADGQSPGLWERCRQISRQSLENLAERIEGKDASAQLVLPKHTKDQIQKLIDHVTYRYKVYHEWGFKQSGQAMGVSALFHGSSGTGKTMAASAIAEQLKLDLYRIDLSQVINKYIGETEKRLSQVFDLAENSGAALLFDEADALFGKRSEVNDSKDRHANIQVSYLLQRLDSFTGIALLTTNFKDNLDEAFVRRFRFIIGFSFPDKAERKIIWHRSFSEGVPTENLNYDQLAKLHLTGSHIRNVSIQAAFIAARQGKPIGMQTIRKAIELEYKKMGKPVNEGEFRGWT